jgi:hypothetical protein
MHRQECCIGTAALSASGSFCNSASPKRQDMPMKKAHAPRPSAALFSLLLGVSGGAFVQVTSGYAQQPIVYPANGQSAQKTEADKSQCMSWATQQTGFDPMAPSPSPAAAPTPSYGHQPGQPGLLRGAAGGAAVGAVGGAVGGDAGKGAAIGAASGALIGGFRRREQQRQNEQKVDQTNQQQAQQYNQARAQFDRGYAVCLEGRGYTVR